MMELILEHSDVKVVVHTTRAADESVPPKQQSATGAVEDLVEVGGLGTPGTTFVPRDWIDAAGTSDPARDLVCDSTTGALVHGDVPASFARGQHTERQAHRARERQRERAQTDTGQRSQAATTADVSQSYRVPDPMARLIRLRDGSCRFPGCATPARQCDLDHVRPWPTGQTTPTNLMALCRHHHRIKQRDGWTVRLHPDGTVTWTDPTGRHHTTWPVDHLHLVTAGHTHRDPARTTTGTRARRSRSRPRSRKNSSSSSAAPKAPNPAPTRSPSTSTATPTADHHTPSTSTSTPTGTATSSTSHHSLPSRPKSFRSDLTKPLDRRPAASPRGISRGGAGCGPSRPEGHDITSGEVHGDFRASHHCQREHGSRRWSWARGASTIRCGSELHRQRLRERLPLLVRTSRRWNVVRHCDHVPRLLAAHARLHGDWQHGPTGGQLLVLRTVHRLGHSDRGRHQQVVRAHDGIRCRAWPLARVSSANR